MEIGELIRKRRIEIGITMREVAEAVGVSEATVSRWETGDIDNMRRDRIMALSQVLRLSPIVLLDGQQKAVTTIDDGLSEDEIEKINLYRDAPEWVRKAVDELLKRQ